MEVTVETLIKKRNIFISEYSPTSNLNLGSAKWSFYVKSFYRAETPKRDRELCVAAHLFADGSLMMITKTDRDWLEYIWPSKWRVFILNQ